MHISDGVLSTPVYLSGFGVSGVIISLIIKNIKTDEIPKVSILTSIFFVASLINIPMGPTSVHLILIGLMGIILGKNSFIAILIGVVLQTLLFQHGGTTAIGVNTFLMGIPALIGSSIFKLRFKIPVLKNNNIKFINGVWGGAVGGISIMLATIILAGFLFTSGEAFIAVAKYAIIAHIPVIITESIVVGFIVSFLTTVKPDMLPD